LTVRENKEEYAAGRPVILWADALGQQARYGRNVMTNTSSAPPGPPAWSVLGERQRAALATLGVMAGIAAIALLIGLPEHMHGPRFPLAVLACVPIAFLRRWPLPALALATAAMTIDMGSGNGVLPLALTLGFATYTVASRVERPFSVQAALAVALVLGAALLFAWIRARAASPAVDAVEGFLPLTAAWFVGDSVAARRRYLAGLAEQAERERIAEAERARREISEERVRIARELHDVIAHGLAVITVQAGVGRRLMGRRPEEAASALASIEEIGRSAQEELRVVLGLLREQDVGPAALAPAPRLADVKALAETVRDAGTPVELHVSGADHELSQGLEVSVYRVIQEALTNVVKHAPGARARVDLTVGAQEVGVEVTDDGGTRGPWPPDQAGSAAWSDGGEAASGPLPSGHGITGMRERVGAFGGTLTAGPAPGSGFRVLAHIPLQEPG
jgi:signal transduction histidine kinase